MRFCVVIVAAMLLLRHGQSLLEWVGFMAADKVIAVVVRLAGVHFLYSGLGCAAAKSRLAYMILAFTSSACIHEKKGRALQGLV